MSFSEKLRLLIDERDLTQKRLALDVGIPASTLGGYVQGTSEPDFETLKLLASYFSVSTDYLLDMREPTAKSPSENELLRVYRSLRTDQQALYLEQGKAILRMNARADSSVSTN